MAREFTCDLCKRTCKRVEAKLYFSPIEGQKNRKGFSRHGAYSHHLDVGECCSGRVLGLFNWRERKPKVKKDA